MASKLHPSVTDTLIAQGLQIKGHLKSMAALYFDGTIVGNITCESDVVLGPNSYVEGKISCQNLTVEGQVTGDIITGGSLTVRSLGRINGNITTHALIVEEGANLRGNLAMDKSTDELTKSHAEHGQTTKD